MIKSNLSRKAKKQDAVLDLLLAGNTRRVDVVDTRINVARIGRPPGALRSKNIGIQSSGGQEHFSVVLVAGSELHAFESVELRMVLGRSMHEPRCWISKSTHSLGEYIKFSPYLKKH